MATVAISALPAATSVGGTDVTPIVQSATTKKVTFSAIFGAPPAIGGTTPAAGAFTTLSATSTFACGGTTIDADVDIFQANSSSGTKFTGRYKNTNASTPNGLSVLYSAADPNGTGSEFLYLVGGASTLRASIRSNGGLANFQANNVNLSDLATKEQFHKYDAQKIWDFGKRMRDAWGRFKYQDQTHDDWNNGYGAQLVQAAAGDDFPELVELSQWGERELLTVYDSDLMHIMGAIVTELQFRLENLEKKLP